MRRSVAPLVVIASVDAEARPACATSTGRWARTVGSPPVRRIPSTSKRSTKIRARRSISSNVSTSLRGSHCHALLGHAVRAAEVAAVGDRDAQVADDAAERVDEIVGSHAASAYEHRAPQRRPPGGTPSPSGTTASASASAVAASWWLPCAPTGVTWKRPSSPNVAGDPDEVDLAVGPAADPVVADRRPGSAGRAGGGPSSGAAPGGRAARS